MPDPHSIMSYILSTYKDSGKWNGQPFEYIKRISNTKVGDVGQSFVETYCGELGYTCRFPLDEETKKRKRQSPWDIDINGIKFEIKSATEDVSGSFQFNHIRYHRLYDALLCVGISPNDIYIGTWSKADLTTNKAGNLVSMEHGANASYKLTKRPNQLFPVSDLKERLDKLLRELEG